jgi:hypothetical protein
MTDICPALAVAFVYTIVIIVGLLVINRNDMNRSIYAVSDNFRNFSSIARNNQTAPVITSKLWSGGWALCAQLKYAINTLSDCSVVCAETVSVAITTNTNANNFFIFSILLQERINPCVHIVTRSGGKSTSIQNSCTDSKITN